MLCFFADYAILSIASDLSAVCQGARRNMLPGARHPTAVDVMQPPQSAAPMVQDGCRISVTRCRDRRPGPNRGQADASQDKGSCGAAVGSRGKPWTLYVGRRNNPKK